MATPSKSASPMPLSELREILRHAQQAGHLQAVMESLSSEIPDSEFEYIPSDGAMTDASKRRMTEPPEKEAVMSGAEVKGTSASPASFGLKLPPGIHDIDEWGRTLLLTGKYARAKFSYEELYRSEKNEHRSYCTWMLSQKHRIDLTAPVNDFVRYINVRFQGQDAGGQCFEGSTIRRQMKAP
eukprot:s9_g43.t1